MEHMNRLAQGTVDGLGANKTSKAIIRVGKVVGVLSSVTESFDSEVGVATPSGRHSEKSTQKNQRRKICRK